MVLWFSGCMSTMRARFVRRLWSYPEVICFSIYTLTYNAFKSQSPFTDAVFEPIFWIIDHFAGCLGRGLVLLVVCLITAVVLIFYAFVLPIVLEYNFLFMVCHLICGHWLLWNIAFHYYKAVSTSPGHPPSGKRVLVKDIQVCTKCIQPKPLRTHHCSVCNKCVLKMDHHCPWVNNCIGHFNHRYFFLFCVYMFLGTVYVSVTTFPKVLDHLDIYAKNIFKDYFIHPSGKEKYLDSDMRDNLWKNLLYTNLTKEIVEDDAKESIHNFVVFEFMLCSCVSLAVGGLALWHVILISKGETSIETYINKSQRQKMKKEGRKFVNPYHYGFRDNWRMLLGLVHGRGFWSIIFPSSHLPHGDGISWPKLATSSENNYHKKDEDEQAFMA